MQITDENKLDFSRASNSANNLAGHCLVAFWDASTHSVESAQYHATMASNEFKTLADLLGYTVTEKED